MGPADILIRNARVYTVDERRPWAQAVAVRGDRIAWVGEDAGAVELVRPATETIDAGGRLVLPGIVDSHNHVRLGGNEDAVQLAAATSLDEVRAAIQSWVDANPDAEWIEGEGFNYGAIPEHLPTADDLEGVGRGKPIFIFTYDVHNVWMNREAMSRFGITRDTERLAFGVPRKDPVTGEPSGFVGDFAVMGISRRGHAALEVVLPGYARDRQYRKVRENVDAAVRFGITTVVEPQNSVDDLPLFGRAREEGDLHSRLVVALFHPPGTTDADLEEFEEAARRFDDDRLRVGPVKLYIDDVSESLTAAFMEPYVGTDTNGETFWEPNEFAQTIAKLDARGFQTFTHACGDRGVKTVLDAVEHARHVNGLRDARHQIVHAECVRTEDLPRFGELGVVACMQPRHCAPEIIAQYKEIIGPERWPRAWPFRSLDANGAVLAFSSDWNVAEMDPLIGMYTAQTRAALDGSGAWVPEQTVDLATAVRAYTIGGAYANHCEGDRGSITPGKYADLAVLSQDLFSLPPEAALETRVELTMVGGEIPHRLI